jgi:arylsulfatase A-like enzyme
MNRINELLSVCLLVSGVATAEVIEYNFETPGNISGTTSDLVYTAPDVNTFGAGITVSHLELSDNNTASSDYGRFKDLGGGSVEAAVNDRSGNTISFTVTVDETVTVDLSSINFDTSFFFTLTGDSIVGWDFYTVAGDTTNNVISSSGWTHDGDENYQSPGGVASGDIALTGLTGLTDTPVTFVWNLDSSRNNVFEKAAMGLDDIVLTGAVVADDGRPRIRLFQADHADVETDSAVVLSWDVARADTIFLSGVGAVSATNSVTVYPAEETTYTLVASNAVGVVQSEVVVTTYEPPVVINSFFADTHRVETNGTLVTFSWDVTHAVSVSIAPDIGEVSSVGQTSVVVNAAGTYTLTASNATEALSKDWNVLLPQTTPNILLMLVDDWGVTDLSEPFAYTHYDDSGEPIITKLNLLHKTPNLEKLARNGMKFTMAYATPKCSSTRATLLTGLHPARQGVTSHLAANSTIGDGPNHWRYNGLDATDVTVAHMLASANYRTVHLGKWHLGGPGDYAQYPTACGFDINIGGSNSGNPGNYIANDTTGFAASGKPAPNLEQYIGTRMYITKALTIELNKAMDDAVDDGVPIFAYMSYYGVHDPETTNPDAVGDYSDAINADHVKFCTMVEAIDVSCSNIVAHLEELGIAEETLIIHLGDNGSENPVHRNIQGLLPAAPFDDFPMRGMKNDGVYQGGCRVPLMITWAKPNLDNPMQQRLPIPSGSVEHDIVGIEDIVPTILSVVGVDPSILDLSFDEALKADPNKQFDGYDLSPYLRGESGTHRPQQYSLHYPNGRSGWYRDGDWKLATRYAEDTFLLFNLATDPTESFDLAASEPERVVQMARAMARDLDSKWRTVNGEKVTLWPVVSGTYPPRPGTDDPLFIPYDVDGRDTVDSDGDGLVDALEDIDSDGLVSATETGADASDTDDDGSDDYTEQRLNLDPRNGHEAFTARMAVAEGSTFRLIWPSVNGTYFNILASTNLQDDVENWQVAVPNVSADAVSNETSRVMGNLGPGSSFYRIELLP